MPYGRTGRLIMYVLATKFSHWRNIIHYSERVTNGVFRVLKPAPIVSETDFDRVPRMGYTCYKMSVR